MIHSPAALADQLDALSSVISDAKKSNPLAPVAVIVPSNYRRHRGPASARATGRDRRGHLPHPLPARRAPRRAPGRRDRAPPGVHAGDRRCRAGRARPTNPGTSPASTPTRPPSARSCGPTRRCPRWGPAGSRRSPTPRAGRPTSSASTAPWPICCARRSATNRTSSTQRSTHPGRAAPPVLASSAPPSCSSPNASPRVRSDCCGRSARRQSSTSSPAPPATPTPTRPCASVDALGIDWPADPAPSPAADGRSRPVG